MKTIKIIMFLVAFSLSLLVVEAKTSKDGLKQTEKKIARITKYGWTGQKMANGKWPKEGYVAVSDRSIKLGSLIWIGYKRYTVGDYTAKWVHELSIKNGFALTIDIYSEESQEEMLSFGFIKEKIALLKV